MSHWHPDTIAGLVMFGPFLIGCLVWLVGHIVFQLMFGWE